MRWRGVQWEGERTEKIIRVSKYILCLFLCEILKNKWFLEDIGESKLPHEVKAFDPKPKDLSSIHWIYTVEKVEDSHT